MSNFPMRLPVGFADFAKPIAGSHWWSGDRTERYWLEATDRADLGADLRSVLADGGGHANWRHTLFLAAVPGDVVFHYDKRSAAITRASVVAGTPEPLRLAWRARSVSAVRRGAFADVQNGYRIPLSDCRALAEPLTLEKLRAAKEHLIELQAELKRRFNGPLYLPFELSKRPVRLLQGYAFNLPAVFVAAFPELIDYPAIDAAPMHRPIIVAPPLAGISVECPVVEPEVVLAETAHSDDR